jgi:hypothetical protein
LKAAVREAVALARKNQRETCGLLIDSGYALNSFLFATPPGDPATSCLTRARSARHSHPVSPARPGRGDIEGTLNDSLMLIIDCIEREARLWYIHDGKARSVRYECVGS